MAAEEVQKSYWRSLEFKVVIAVTLIVTCLVFLIIQRKQEQSREAGTIKPVQEINRGAGSLPAPERTEPTSPLYPPDDWSNSQPPDRPDSGLSGRILSKKLPEDAAPNTKTEPYPLPTPPTQVHPLAEADAVMGVSSSGAGQVGVTTVHKLPDQNGPVQTRSLDGNSIDTPPGIPSGEAGRSKSYPLPKEDPGQP